MGVNNPKLKLAHMSIKLLGINKLIETLYDNKNKGASNALSNMEEYEGARHKGWLWVRLHFKVQLGKTNYEPNLIFFSYGYFLSK